MGQLTRDLTEVELTLEQVAVRNTETDEESTKWQVSHPELNRPCRADTPRKALEIFGECLEAEEETRAIDLDALAE